MEVANYKTKSMSQKQTRKSRDNFLALFVKARRNGDQKRAKLFFDLAVTLNNSLIINTK